MKLYNGDCLDILKTLESNSIDSCVTDPPYGINFMGKSWDYDVPKIEIWQEVYRVLKPGAHLLSFFGTKTYHRGVINIEDAGFEIRDQIQWIYGTGFPKSYNQGQSIEKLLTIGKARRKDRDRGNLSRNRFSGSEENSLISNTGGKIELTTNEAKQWEGWETALKPAQEPIVLARKPLSEKTVAENILKWNTGAMNISDCKIETEGTTGRFPSNVILENSNEISNLFKDKTRFFYSVKASVNDREEGLEDLESRFQAGAEFRPNHMQKALEGHDGNPYGRYTKRKNIHPTVKPNELMKYLCTLVTPKNGIILDPFMGSGSTGKAALQCNFDFYGIEIDEYYFQIAQKRIQFSKGKNTLF